MTSGELGRGIGRILLAIVAGCGSASDDPGRPPNVVLILADDCGVECFGSYGGQSYATPNLDRLAAGGCRFTSAHAQPLCTPSRVELMTGRSNLRDYVRFSILDPEAWTFGHLFRAAGYATGVVGKWQLYGAEHYGEHAGTGSHPLAAGFDEYCLWQLERLGSRYWQPLIETNAPLSGQPDEDYGPSVFVAWALEFMRRHRDEPFLLYYPMALVHDPFEPTPVSADPSGTDRARNFADMVAWLDRSVGALVDGLDRLGLREGTLVLFASDNGTHKSITSLRDGRPVRGGKATTTDRATHVPLIVNQPGRIPPGGSCGDLIGLPDVLPTLAEAAGLALPAERVIDGRSFLPQALGRPGRPRAALFSYMNPRPAEHPEWERRWARGRRYKLYDNGLLFDLAQDPDEERPLGAGASSAAARAARRELEAVLARWDFEAPNLARPK